MRTASLVMLSALSLALPGCATRGAIKIACEGFREHVTTPAPSRLVSDIQSDTGPVYLVKAPLADVRDDGTALVQGGAPPSGTPLEKAIEASILRAAGVDEATPDIASASLSSRPPAGILLLSGGGQWGAFGAGFLKTLQAGTKARDFSTITGVSTGGLQALFVAIDQVDGAAYQKLSVAYQPEKESEVVDRNAQFLAVITGSFAGLKPLKRKIEATLCTRGDPRRGCPMIEALAKSGRNVLIGFVNAQTGAFEYADAVAFARAGQGGGPAALGRAQRCLTGIALASAAMPVFFQQVRIEGVTYYDGGVRQSVFEESVGASVDSALALARARLREAKDYRAAAAVQTPPLFVIRNGPTRLLDPEKGEPGDDARANRKADALTAAERAETILVNQLEVGSIASLRLAHPTGEIWLVTADGFHDWDGDARSVGMGCKKKRGPMFEPEFMKCLQLFGGHKAARTDPWRSISELSLRPSVASDVAAQSTPAP